MRGGVKLVGLALLALAGLASGLFAAGGGASTDSSAKPARSAVTRVTVTASEFTYKFSKRSVPTGTVIFTVVNKGKISHDFKIRGRKTPTLAPGKSAKLTVSFAKKGRYPFLCTIPGHAGAGMKGQFAVATKPVAPPPTTAPPTTPPTTTTPPPTGPVGGAQTTVQVGMFEYGFNYSQPTAPSGQVTFVIRNNGSEVHNFAIAGVKSGALLSPGQTETWTVSLPSANYNILCDVPFHVDRGMVSTFNITS
jgi:uncharacterized cupredoxin-like copper-binding protein